MAQEEIRTRTYEELIINRIVRAFEVMDNSTQPQAKEQFDEVLEELEMLFRLDTDMSNLLQQHKIAHQKMVKNNFAISDRTCSAIENEYLRKIQANKDEYEIEWGYRKDMLESVLNILNEFQRIPFSRPIYAEIEAASSAPAPESIPEPEPEPEPEPAQPTELDLLKQQMAELQAKEAVLQQAEEDKKVEQMKIQTRKQVQRHPAQPSKNNS
jgi:SHS2 domain-containing protein